MKISTKTKFIVVALGILPLVGCGGGLANSNQAQFPQGIYVPTGDGKSVKYCEGTLGTGPQEFLNSDNDYTDAVAIGKGKLYFSVGISTGKLFCITSPTDTQHVAFTGVPGDSLGSIRTIAVDKSGRIYLADYTNQRIIRINDMSGNGYKVLSLLPYSIGPIDFGRSLALDSQGRIYVSGLASGKLLRFENMDDASPETFAATGAGMLGFDDPNDIAIDKQDRIYVTDRDHHRVCRFDDMVGSNWITFDVQSANGGAYTNICDIAVTDEGTIYVTDTGQDRICRFNDMSGSAYITFGSKGTGFGKYPEMRDILVR